MFKVGDVIVKNYKENRVYNAFYTESFNAFLKGGEAKIISVGSFDEIGAWAQNSLGSFGVYLDKIKLKESPKMSNTFTKDMLKSGMRVVLNNNQTYVVFVADGVTTFCGITGDSLTTWMPGENYSFDLKLKGDTEHGEYDVKKVVGVDRYALLKIGVQTFPIWDREQPKPETLELNGKTYLKSDIEEALAKLSPIEE